MGNEIQVLITFSGIIMSGLSAYVGVKVAIAEQKEKTANNREAIIKLESRMDRLERKYFAKDE